MRDTLIIAVVFLLARMVCWQLGVGFDADNLGTWWQIADPELLRVRLLPTLFYLHSQPPGFNLLIGLALKAGMEAFPVIMAWVYGAVCLGGLVCLHAMGRTLLGSRRVSLAIALWFCVSPDVLLFNEKLFYDGLVPWLLCAGFWGMHAGLKTGQSAKLAFGFAMLATVVLTRSMFHPLWFAIVIGLAFAFTRARGRVLACAALPVGAVVAVLVKNLVVFGFLGLSSWATLNIVGVTVERLPLAERQQLIADGVLSRLSASKAFSPIAQLLPLLPPLPVTGEPVLDNPVKANGQPNMNHEAMLVASRLRLPDAIATLRADPGLYAAVLAISVYHFHRPANEFRDIRRNLVAIEGWARTVNATLGLQPAAWFGSSLDTGRPSEFWLQVSYGSVLISICFTGAVWRSLLAVIGAMRRRGDLSAETISMVLILWTGTFVFLISTAFDVLENNRARYTVAPLLTLAAAWYVLQRVRAAKALYQPAIPTQSLLPQ